MIAALAETGAVIAAAGAGLAPADRRLYALRDVTGTVESIPLIASSIMSKKIAEGTSALVLDVKTGTGAFMTSPDRALDLARTMVAVGAEHGVRTRALVTRMDTPLGRAVGNALEVTEAIAALRGEGPADLMEVTLALARHMLDLAGLDADPAEAIATGRALDTFRKMISAQGGDPDAPLPQAATSRARSRPPAAAGSPGWTREPSASPPGAWEPAAPARKTASATPPASAAWPSPGTACGWGSGVTVFPGVPALFRVLATLPPGATLGGLRTTISAGAILAPETAQAFHARFGVKIHNFYGSSETGGITYDSSGGASLTGRSVGKPLRGVKVTVREGRITVASRAVSTPGGTWRLPDRGEWNGRGELVLLGRAGRGANIGGKKVHPLEIERALRALPGVSDAHVWLEHRHGRDSLEAAVETRLTRATIEHALAAKLPAWKMPKHFLIAEELPRTARGKLDVARIKM